MSNYPEQPAIFRKFAGKQVKHVRFDNEEAITTTFIDGSSLTISIEKDISSLLITPNVK